MKIPKLLILTTLLIEALTSIAQAATVTLAWDPSPDSPVTYRLVIDGATNDVGAALTHQVKDLIGGRTYTFRVHAVDTNGFWSDPSNTVIYTPSEGVPPAPVLVSQDGVVTALNQWTITLSWQAAPAPYVVTNYLMIVRQGTTSRTNQAGTNLTSQMTVPAFNTTEAFLQSQNNQGFSPLVQVGNYRKPGASRFLKVTQP